MNKKLALVVLGGCLIRKDNGWRTTDIDEGDNFGPIGDRLRVVAASFIYKNNPSIIILLGGKGQLKHIPDIVPVSQVMKQELIDLGVRPKNIITEVNSDNTWQQLQKLKKIIIDKEIKKLSIISNRYHLLRIKVMVEKIEYLKNMSVKGKIKLLSAEEILIKHNPTTWEERIKFAYQSEAMKKRIKFEQRGVREIKTGKYKLK